MPLKTGIKTYRPIFEFIPSKTGRTFMWNGTSCLKVYDGMVPYLRHFVWLSYILRVKVLNRKRNRLITSTWLMLVLGEFSPVFAMRSGKDELMRSVFLRWITLTNLTLYLKHQNSIQNVEMEINLIFLPL
jgi:hypothetical protein